MLAALSCASCSKSATEQSRRASASSAASASAPSAPTATQGSAAGAANEHAVGQPAGAASVARADVFFFGHSLVDQDMPLMVGSFAKARGKTYSAKGQLGWGTALETHWNWNGSWTDAPLGFVEENRDRVLFAGEGKAQLATGRYDVLVMTESNGHTRGNGDQTVDYVTRFARLARQHNPRIRVFLYASWLDRNEFASLEQWQTRTEADVAWWEKVVDRVDAQLDGPDIQLIPGAAILARVTREVARGTVPGLKVDALFRHDDGVHVNDLGFYVIALAHYAAIFRDSTLDLPLATDTEDGPAETMSAAAAARVQRIVWDYLQSYPRAGIARAPAPAPPPGPAN